MHQVIALVLDQRIRLAHEDVVVHHRTVYIPGPAGREDRLGFQRREAWTEEHESRVLCPETRHGGLSAAIKGLVIEVVFLAYVRLCADKGGVLIASCGVGGG